MRPLVVDSLFLHLFAVDSLDVLTIRISFVIKKKTSTSMTLARQEIDHPTTSSSSSTSPTMTSSTVSSESVARQERGDPCGIDPYPAAVSRKHVERQERGDPCSSETSEEVLHEPTKIPKPNKKRRPRSRTERPVKFRHTGHQPQLCKATVRLEQGKI